MRQIHCECVGWCGAVWCGVLSVDARWCVGVLLLLYHAATTNSSALLNYPLSLPHSSHSSSLLLTQHILTHIAPSPTYRYGGGRADLSDTMAGTLWVADALFAFAAGGARAFHLHWGHGGLPFQGGSPNVGVQTNFDYNVSACGQCQTSWWVGGWCAWGV